MCTRVFSVSGLFCVGFILLLSGGLLSLSCSSRSDSFPVPLQVTPVTESPGLSSLQSEIDVTRIASFAQIVDGIHLKEPHWLPARWVYREAHIELLYNPNRHKAIRVRGLIENPQLDLTGPMTIRLSVDGQVLLKETLTRDVVFEFHARIANRLRHETGVVAILVEASPGWKPEWSDKEFTFGLSTIGFVPE